MGGRRTRRGYSSTERARRQDNVASRRTRRKDASERPRSEAAGAPTSRLTKMAALPRALFRLLLIHPRAHACRRVVGCLASAADCRASITHLLQGDEVRTGRQFHGPLQGPGTPPARSMGIAARGAAHDDIPPGRVALRLVVDDEPESTERCPARGRREASDCPIGEDVSGMQSDARTWGQGSAEAFVRARDLHFPGQDPRNSRGARTVLGACRGAPHVRPAR
jgi:hypothetical protein